MGTKRNFQKDDETMEEDKKTNKNKKNNRRNNTRRNSRNSRNCDQTKDRKGDNGSIYKSGDNDAEWYMRYPELARDASKIPFTTPLGKYPSVGENFSVSRLTVAPTAYAVPGIMAIEWMPTIGQSSQENSPINIVSREVYSFIRHANSGHSNYDAPDMMMYLLSMDSLYSFYSAMTRVYGIMMLYSGMNRYMPRTLVEALGFNFDDISANLAQFRWLINQVAYKLTAMYVPAGMSYYERHIWLNSGIYLDSTSYKAQTYVFKQKAYYRYSADSSTNYAATLKYTPVPDNLTVSKCSDFVNSLLNPILADEDMNIISGDMLRAFGADNLFTVAPISEDYVVVPMYNQEVLSQIQNLTILGDPDTSKDTFPGLKADIVQRINVDNFNTGVYQNLSFIVSTAGKVTSNEDDLIKSSYVGFDRFITMLNDNPSSEEIMVASRLANICDTYGIEDQPGDSSRQAAIVGASFLSTEVVNHIKYYTITADNTYKTWDLSQAILINWYLTQDQSHGANIMRDISQVSAFDWHPLIYLMHTTDNTGKVTVDGTLLETNNFTVLDANDLERLHETALISEFYVPNVRNIAAKPIK